MIPTMQALHNPEVVYFSFLLFLLSVLPAGAQSPNENNGNGPQPRVKRTASFELEQSIDVLFPLFSAEGETLWVPGWTYENIMGTTELSEDYVFLTKDHDHAAAESIWLTKRYEPEKYQVQFYKIEPGNKVGIITVQCQEIEAGTRIQVTYEYIALTEQAHTFIEEFTQDAYAEYIGEWNTLLRKYFAEKVPHIKKPG